MSPTRERLCLIATLYVSQAIPLGFFIVALPAILRREGLSLEYVGVLGALALPFLLKFLWAPFILPHAERGIGNGVQVGGYYLGQVLDRSDPDTAATDFSLQQSLCAVGAMLGSTLSGVSAARLGYSGHFGLCAGLSLLGAGLVAWRLTDRTAAPQPDVAGAARVVATGT